MGFEKSYPPKLHTFARLSTVFLCNMAPPCWMLDTILPAFSSPQNGRRRSGSGRHGRGTAASRGISKPCSILLLLDGLGVGLRFPIGLCGPGFARIAVRDSGSRIGAGFLALGELRRTKMNPLNCKSKSRQAE
jgi:hypothetical protein